MVPTRSPALAAMLPPASDDDGEGGRHASHPQTGRRPQVVAVELPALRTARGEGEVVQVVPAVHARAVDVSTALSNSFGFGGHNASVVLERAA